jgi:hypothetical protein
LVGIAAALNVRLALDLCNYFTTEYAEDTEPTTLARRASEGRGHFTAEYAEDAGAPQERLGHSLGFQPQEEGNKEGGGCFVGWWRNKSRELCGVRAQRLNCAGGLVGGRIWATQLGRCAVWGTT